MKFNRLQDCVITNKNIILRVDINVPIKDGIIQDDTRIRAIIPTIKYLAENKAKIIIISHFGRPKGQINPEMSLKPLLNRISELSNIKVDFCDEVIGDKVAGKISQINYGEAILLENLRFYKEETDGDEEFSQKLAQLGNLYVNDAFSCSHRSHASITGIPKFLKSAAGLLLEKELDNLQNLVQKPKKPMIAIVGGSKVSTKIDLINALIEKSEAIVIAGGMANSFLYAQNYDIANSLCEKDLKETALAIIHKAKKYNCQLILPKDIRVCKKIENNANARNINLKDIESDDIIADIGLNSAQELADNLDNFSTIVWNGPLGAFEFKPFNEATNIIANKVSQLTKEGKLISVAGGGDVVSALNQANLADDFSYISTAGGAFLEWLEGKSLPGIIAISN